MAKNPYFFDSSSEQRLVEDLTEETIRSMGREVYYIPRELVNKDNLFGEDTISKFSDSYKIEMYVNSVGGFEGQGNIISKFGIEIKDRVELVVSRRRFSNLITRQDAGVSRPTEGDLIFFPDSKTMFEINFVEHENPFYPLGRLYTYVLSCEAFTYSYEDFDTEESFIDGVTAAHTNTGFELIMKSVVGGGEAGSGISSGYEIGETIYHVVDGDGTSTLANATGTGKVYSWNQLNDANVLLVGDQSGTFDLTENEYFIGASSGVKAQISSVVREDIIIPAGPIYDTDLLDNVDIEKLGREDGVFDFTDIDPFSEGNY